MAEIRDEQGNPIPLTDELGRAVQLTDERGVPIHLTGVATTGDSGTTAISSEPKMQGGTHFTPAPAEPIVEQAVTVGEAPVSTVGAEEGEKQQLGKSGSSSSSSDDGQGGRRKKKKGWMQKIKEKLPGGGHHKNKEGEQITPEKVYTATTKIVVTTPAGPTDEPKTERIQVEHHEEEHEKKGLMDKIKDKLPGHHSH